MQTNEAHYCSRAATLFLLSDEAFPRVKSNIQRHSGFAKQCRHLYRQHFTQMDGRMTTRLLGLVLGAKRPPRGEFLSQAALVALGFCFLWQVHDGHGLAHVAVFEVADAWNDVSILVAGGIEGRRDKTSITKCLQRASNDSDTHIRISTDTRNRIADKRLTWQKLSAASGHVTRVTTVIFSSSTPC